MKYRKKGDPKTELKRSLKAVNWKLAAEVFLVLIAVFSVYQIFVYLEIGFIVHIYAGALFVLAAAYVLLARGLSCRPLDESAFPDDWSSERREKYLAGDVKRKRIAKKLLVFILPILLTFLFDMIYIIYFSG